MGLRAIAGGSVVSLCALWVSPATAQLDIGTIIYHESYDGESAFPTTPEVNTLGLGGLDEFRDGATGFPGGADLSAPDRAHVQVGSVNPADNGINDVYVRSALPSFGPGDAYGLRGQFDGWRPTEGGGGPTDAGSYGTGVIMGDYVGVYDASIHRFLAAILTEQIGVQDPDNPMIFPLGVNFVIQYVTPDEPLVLTDVPIPDAGLLALPFAIDMVVERTTPSVVAEIRFLDGADVAFSTSAALLGPAFPIKDTDDLRMFGQFAVIGNVGAGDLVDVDFLDLELGRSAQVPEPNIAGLYALFAIGAAALNRRRVGFVLGALFGR